MANGLLYVWLAVSFQPLWMAACKCGDPAEHGQLVTLMTYAVVTDRPQEPRGAEAAEREAPCPANPAHNRDARFREDRMPGRDPDLPPGTRLCIRIDRKGQVTEVLFRGDTLRPGSAAAVEAAVRRIPFRPATLNGRRVTTWSEFRSVGTP